MDDKRSVDKQSVPGRVTSSQIARLAGVSRTTVSFVLNDVKGMQIADETRARVLRTARELGYVPNAAARTLVSGRTNTVALAIPHGYHFQVDAFIPPFLQAINTYCHERGYKVLLEPVEEIEHPRVYLDLVHARRIDGLIVLNPRDSEGPLFAELSETGFPLVVTSAGPSEYPTVYAVGSDGYSAARGLTRHLLSLGHRYIAHIGYGARHYGGVALRERAYRDALAEAGVVLPDGYVEMADFSAQSGYRVMAGMLSRLPELTAVFAGNDTIAIGALAAIRERGLRVPEDIAVVGFDDIPVAAYTAPPLTTIHSAPAEQGALAANVLLDLIAGRSPASRFLCVPLPMVVRASCGAAASPAFGA